MNIKDKLPKVKENIFLAKHTTFKIGGRACYFFKAKNKEDLIKAVRIAKEFKMPFFILGEGSNVLFSDKGFKGLIIKTLNSKFQILDSKIYAEAGVELDKLVKLSLKESFTGLEWAVGIPGTMGGAIYGNAQAFNNKMSDMVEKVEVLDIKGLKIKNLSKKQCRFSQKNSVFKTNKNLIIISEILKLKKGKKKEIKEKIKKYLNYRKRNHPLNFPSAGSVFINKEIKIKSSKLLKKFPELKELNKKGIIPSAYLIEKCGLKGKKIGKAQISDKHANFIVNLGGAKAKDVLKLMKLAKQKVKKNFKISLKEEIQIIN